MGTKLAAAATVLLSCALSACTQSTGVLDSVTTASVAKPRAASTKERDCLARAMFFESLRSSREGLVAVGTVVMNRVDSSAYPDTICGVVGQKNQFAPGVLSRQMNSKALPDVMAAADAVLAGERHPAITRAKFFHQAGLTFPYDNMHYVLEAGGNAFYEKRSRARKIAAEPPAPPREEKTPADALPARAMAYDATQEGADMIGALLLEKARRAE